jgi:hypothetical protein
VLIVGGRYGSEKSGSTTAKERSGFFERYDSITKQEYRSALASDIPIYILVESAVYAEYRTFTQNRGNEGIVFAHVDSINVFHLLDEILGQRRNNPVHTFDHYNEIEAWLREQWAGLFRELLKRSSNQQQLASLQAQVGELAEINQTLRRYLEEVVSKVAPDKSANLIQSESHRLEEAQKKERIRNNMLLSSITGALSLSFDSAYEALQAAADPEDFADRVGALTKDATDAPWIKGLFHRHRFVWDAWNEARHSLGLPTQEKPEILDDKRYATTRSRKSRARADMGEASDRAKNK